MMKEDYQELVIAEMSKFGWIKANDDVAHAVIAKFPVKTINGDDFAEITPLIQYENGVYSVGGRFVSRGHNVLACDRLYFKDAEELKANVSAFHTELMRQLSDAFSIRIARARSSENFVSRHRPR